MIKHISFESRHEQAEGIDFVVDIELLKRNPFFAVTVDTNGAEMEDDAVLQELERAFVFPLWRRSKGATIDITLSCKDLVALSAIFVKAMR